MKLIVFDIDGTLLYTGGSGRIAFEKAFEEMFGIPEVWQDLVPDGKTDPMIIDEIVQRVLGRSLSAAEYEQLTVRYHHYFDREILNPPKFRILPGVPELLNALADVPEVILGIATGNFEQAARAKLRQGKIESFFRFGGFASDHGDRTELTRLAIERGQKLHPEKISPEQIFLLGDTPYDIAAGRKLGVQTVGVATGKTNVREFKERCQAHHAVEDLSDTRRLLNLFGAR